MAIEVKLLASAELDSASNVLADAFRDDPTVSYYFPVPAKRHALLPEYMRLGVDVAFPLGESLGLWNDGTLVAAALLLPPGHTSLPLPTVLSALSKRRSLWDPGALARYVNYSVGNARNHPKGEHWYLFVIGVRTSLQGRGLGKALMERVIEKSEGSGLPVFLETCVPRNVPFYESLGFVTTARLHPGLGSTPETWCMARAVARPPKG